MAPKTLVRSREGSAELPLELLAQEREYIAARRERVNERRRTDCLRLLSETNAPTGLALSGGGIRSAVFCLGFMQALAAKNVLEQFDYLSTVSGGGYIGGALTWWTSPRAQNSAPTQSGVSSSDFPWGVGDPGKSSQTNSKLLDDLREHGSYLLPGHGITIWSAIGVVLRGILLNLVVWLPLTVAVLAVLSLPVSGPFRSYVPDWPQGAAPNAFANKPIFLVLVWLAVVLAGIFLAWSMFYSFATSPERRAGAFRYGVRRAFEEKLGILLKAWLLFLIIGTVPWVSSTLDAYVAHVGGPIAFAIGIVGGIYAQFKSPSSDDKARGASGISLSVAAPIAATLALYGFLLIAWDLADGPLVHALGVKGVACVVVFSVLSGTIVNLNYISLHRFYRDRVMEAFMPDFDPTTNAYAAEARRADVARLSAMCDPESPIGPYHLINTNLILNDATALRWPLRGGDAFVLSPRFCGSTATGWTPTKEFVDDGMTLPTAIAISGASINPDAAADGIGPTRSTSISVLLALLNIRLGYWIKKPGSGGGFPPNHFDPGVTEFLGRAASQSARRLQLSDGGHFENLGIYELLRRKCRLIVACDADQDEDFAFEDLKNLLTLAEQDCGASIDFGYGGLDPLMPRRRLIYPAGVMCSDSAYLCGKIVYRDAPPGTLIYVKATLLQRLRLELLGYRGTDPEFPDDTTLDQFFDEPKFEAYRELGFAIADRLLTGIDPCELSFQALLS